MGFLIIKRGKGSSCWTLNNVFFIDSSHNALGTNFSANPFDISRYSGALSSTLMNFLAI